ncbi:MAG: 50S ribosomal protein L22 [Candidatus Gastranaerophilales bacterium]|nr:50S ribosomal protein L22 [Candidatus Gastranaerophilales bacterium]
MEARSRQKYIKMPARKLRRVMNEVRGKSADEAMNILHFMPYTAAKVVEMNLKCAIANAAEKWGVSSEGLTLTEIFADEGPTYKRIRPRAQGRVYKRLKRTSHLSLKVTVNTTIKNKSK